MPARAFLAIDPPSPARRLLERAGAAFLAEAPAWAGEKWVPGPLLHVTVEFLGPVADPAVRDLLERLGDALADLPAYPLSIEGVRAVPGPRHATMVWGRLGGDLDSAREMHARVARVVERCVGIVPGQSPFSPHVTLVRARGRRTVPATALEAADAVIRGARADVIGTEDGKAADGFLSVHEVTLYASTLGRGGPAYERLGSARLGGMRA